MSVHLMRWNYGKYRRRNMQHIPTDYLLWFVINDGTEWASPKRKHRMMAIEELRRRGVEISITNRATELAVRKLASLRKGKALADNETGSGKATA
jgi:uncharacterized protein (DUF3820 family)